MHSFKKLLKDKIQYYAKILGISDYSYNLNIRNNKKSANNFDIYGSVFIDEETREAIININKALLKREPHEIDSTIVHELLHVRFSELLTLVDMILNLYVKDKKAKKAYVNQIEQLEHKMIISLTEILRKK
jgi:hypothetical protein